MKKITGRVSVSVALIRSLGLAALPIGRRTVTRIVRAGAQAHLARADTHRDAVVPEEMLKGLAVPVRRYLADTGTAGQLLMRTLHPRMKGTQHGERSRLTDIVARRYQKVDSGYAADARREGSATFAWWERWASSRQGTVLMFIWAFAESTVWPIVPDFLLVPMAVGNRRRYDVPLRAAILGMAVGGTGIYLFAFYAPREASRLLPHLPTVHERAIAGARDHLHAHGIWAFLFQPWSGIPLKVWAIVGGAQGLNPLLVIPTFIVARSLRMALLATLARRLAERRIGFVRQFFPFLVMIYVTLFFAGWWRLIRPGRQPMRARVEKTWAATHDRHMNVVCSGVAARWRHFRHRRCRMQPQVVNHQRVAALRFGDPRVQTLLSAIVLFAFVPRGFTHHQLRERLTALLGLDSGALPAGRVTYDLRRLRLHGLIVRTPGTQRYHPTDQGLRVALFCSRVYLRVLRPGLAQVLAPTPPADPALRPAFDTLTTAIDQFLEDAHCAA